MNKTILLTNENVTYTEVRNKDIENSIITFGSSFITKSFNNLSKDEQKMITLEHRKIYDKIFKNLYITRLLPQILDSITDHTIKFKVYLDYQ